MDIKSLKAEYDSKQKLFERIEDAAKFILSQAISRCGLKIHSLPSRIKSFDSFNDKMKRKKIKNPFEEIHDIIGLRIICLFLDDIQGLSDIIKKAFDVIKEDNILKDAEPHFFGYLGRQFKVKFKDKGSIPDYHKVKDVTFEIQVRTIAQDAWASISHHLDYKHEYGIPNRLERDFYALNGLFYVADTHFEMLKKEQFKYLTSKK